jgi:uncharacterized protein (DUF305 family)
MQINIDKKSGIFISIITILLVIIGALFLGQGMRHHDDNRAKDMDRDKGVSINSPESSSSLSFQGNDIMFAQMMIPHHEQAVEMSDFALLTSTNPEVLALAKDIRDAQAPEILQMKGWLKMSNSSLDMGHSMGGGMGGMLSDSEVTTLKNATGKTFDTLFLNGMIAHHEGAIHMTLMIKDSANPEVKTLGENIVTSQTAQITLMKDMLSRIK